MPFAFYWSNSKSSRDHTPVDRVVVYISGPIQWFVVTTLDGVVSLWHRYVNLVDAQEENDRLRAENAHLKSEIAVREEQRIENDRLRRLVGLKEQAPEVKMIYANVVAISPTPLFRSIRIDRGERDGATLGAAVVTHDGVVGRIAALAEAYADVMLMVDANSSTDVVVQRTRARARVRGTGSDTHLGIQVDYLSRLADVEPGDTLITSGTGPVFPKGLVVGTVMAVERGAFGLYQRALVEPSVDFGRIEGVMIVSGGATPQTNFEQRDLEEPLPLVDKSGDAQSSSVPPVPPGESSTAPGAMAPGSPETPRPPVAPVPPPTPVPTQAPELPAPGGAQ